MRKSNLLTSFLSAWLISLLVLLSACNKDDQNATPSTEWQLTYVVTSIGDVTVDEITYRDEFRQEQVIPGQRDFRTSFNSESGFVGNLEVKGTATSGGIIARIEAVALDGSFKSIANTDDDGQAGGGGAKNVRLSVQLLLP